MKYTGKESFWADAQLAELWRKGKTNCPLCFRFGCRGQCDCYCRSCQRGLEERREGEAIPFCDVLRELRETKEQRAERVKREASQQSLTPTWGECIARVERLGVPHATAKAARAPQLTKALEAAKGWWRTKQDKPFLGLWGPPGLGKSVAAAYLAAKWGESAPWWKDLATGANTRTVVWLNAPELGRLTLLKEQEEALLADARRAHLLVVDDVELEGGQAGLRALGQLLSARADSLKATVLTGNLVPKRLRDIYGSHLADRLVGCCVSALLEGASMRGKS